MKRLMVLPLLLLTPFLRAQIAFGPERLVAEPNFDNVSGSTVATATTASDTLVVVAAGFFGSLYGQWLDASARPLTAHGFPIARNVDDLGGVAAGRNGYVVVWRSDNRHSVRSVYVTTSGISAPQLLATSGNGEISLPNVASNGSGYLVTWTGGEVSSLGAPISSQPMALRLDSAGNIAGSAFPLAQPHKFAGVTALASDGRDYLAAMSQSDDGNASTASLLSISADGAVSAPANIPSVIPRLLHTADGYVGMWSGPTTINSMHYVAMTTVARVDATGRVGPQVLVMQSPLDSAATNGRDFVLAGFDGRAWPAPATRFRSNGDSFDMVDQSYLYGGGLVAGATYSGDYFVISTAFAPLDVELIRPAVATHALTMADHPLMTFAAQQAAPRMATDGRLVVASWLAGSQTFDQMNVALRATRVRDGVPLDPKGIDVAPAAFQHDVATNGTQTLIVWSEQEIIGQGDALPGMWVNSRLWGCILHDDDGTLSGRFEIARVQAPLDFIVLTGAVDTAGGFAVVWGDSRGFQYALLDVNGTRLGTASLPLDSHRFDDASLVRRRDGFLLLHLDQKGIFAAPFHADGTAAGAEQRLDDTTWDDVRPSAASDGDGRFVVVWTRSHDSAIWSQAIDENGTPAATPRLLGSSTRARVGWSGSAFTVFGDGGGVARLSANGGILFPLTPLLPPDTAAAFPLIDTVAYVRSGIDSGVGDVPVVFVRRFTTARRRASN